MGYCCDGDMAERTDGTLRGCEVRVDLVAQFRWESEERHSVVPDGEVELLVVEVGEVNQIPRLTNKNHARGLSCDAVT